MAKSNEKAGDVHYPPTVMVPAKAAAAQTIEYLKGGNTTYTGETLAAISDALGVTFIPIDSPTVDAGTIFNDIAKNRAAGDEFVGPLTPAEWRRRFGDGKTAMSETTWRRVKRKIQVDEITTKSLRIHRDDVARYEKKPPATSH